MVSYRYYEGFFYIYFSLHSLSLYTNPHRHHGYNTSGYHCRQKTNGVGDHPDHKNSAVRYHHATAKKHGQSTADSGTQQTGSPDTGMTFCKWNGSFGVKRQAII